MLRVLRRLAQATIWHAGAIPDTEGEYARDLKRWALPTVDLLLILGSIFGISGGMPSVLIVYNELVSRTTAWVVLIFALGCLIGVSFPRLWVLEFASKCGLVFVLITYALLLVGLAASGNEARWFIAGVTSACAVVPSWRIIWLGREHRRRVLARIPEED